MAGITPRQPSLIKVRRNPSKQGDVNSTEQNDGSQKTNLTATPKTGTYSQEAANSQIAGLNIESVMTPEEWANEQALDGEPTSRMTDRTGDGTNKTQNMAQLKANKIDGNSINTVEGRGRTTGYTPTDETQFTSKQVGDNLGTPAKIEMAKMAMGTLGEELPSMSFPQLKILQQLPSKESLHLPEKMLEFKDLSKEFQRLGAIKVTVTGGKPIMTLSEAREKDASESESLKKPDARAVEIKKLETLTGLKAPESLYTAREGSSVGVRVLKAGAQAAVGFSPTGVLSERQQRPIYEKQQATINAKIQGLKNDFLGLPEVKNDTSLTLAFNNLFSPKVKGVDNPEKSRLRSDKREGLNIDQAEALSKNSTLSGTEGKKIIDEIMMLKCLETPIQRNLGHVSDDSLEAGVKLGGLGIALATGGTTGGAGILYSAFKLGRISNIQEKGHQASQKFESSEKSVYDCCKAVGNHAEKKGIATALRGFYNDQDTAGKTKFTQFLNDTFGEDMAFTMLTADSLVHAHKDNPAATHRYE